MWQANQGNQQIKISTMRTRKIKRLKWTKDQNGWFGQPPLYFSIYKNKKQWRLIIAEFWKKEGSQKRDIPIDSVSQGKLLASELWKKLV